MRTTHWWIYTVLIGLVPLLVRFVIYVSVRGATLEFVVNEGDLVSFGLVMGVANINELDHLPAAEARWKTLCMGYSVISIIVFAALLVLANLASLNPAMLDLRNIKILLIVLCGVVGVLSYIIHGRDVPAAAPAVALKTERIG